MLYIHQTAKFSHFSNCVYTVGLVVSNKMSLKSLSLKHSRCSVYVALIVVNFIYACTGICTKMASRQEILSWPYLLWMAGVVGVIGVYAILWQQIITRIPISTAYMFKGTGLIFGLLFAHLLFSEQITVYNVIGAATIIIGIALFSKA